MLNLDSVKEIIQTTARNRQGVYYDHNLGDYAYEVISYRSFEKFKEYIMRTRSKDALSQTNIIKQISSIMAIVEGNYGVPNHKI